MLNFRLWYDSEDELLEDEVRNLFPPCFKLKVIKTSYNIPEQNIVYKICIQSEDRDDKNIVIDIPCYDEQVLDNG